MPHAFDLNRKLVAEAVGTALLLATVVGSGRVPLILTFGPISGAHFNPAVTIVDVGQGGLPSRHAALYIAIQVVAAVAGVLLANMMFGEPTVAWSRHARQGGLRRCSVSSWPPSAWFPRSGVPCAADARRCRSRLALT